MNTQDMKSAVAAFARTLAQTDERGHPLFSQDKVDHFIPFAFFSLEMPFMGLKPRHQTLLKNFVEKLNLPDGTNVEQLKSAALAYYKTNPVDPRLRMEWDHALRGIVVVGSSAELDEDQKRQMGEAPVQGSIFENTLQDETDQL